MNVGELKEFLMRIPNNNKKVFLNDEQLEEEQLIDYINKLIIDTKNKEK